MKGYGALELTVSSPPQSFAEVLSLAQVRTFLKLPTLSPADAEQDDLLGSFIIGARSIAETEQNKDLISKQYDLHLDLLLGHDAIAGAAYPLRYNSIYNFGIGYEIELRHPLQSVQLFQHTDRDGSVMTLEENTDYVVDTHRSLVCPPWGKVWPFFTPAVTSAVLIRFTAGYLATHPFWSNEGAPVLTGMKLLITAWHENRIPFGARVDEMPYGITCLLRHGARPRVK